MARKKKTVSVDDPDAIEAALAERNGADDVADPNHGFGDDDATEFNEGGENAPKKKRMRGSQMDAEEIGAIIQQGMTDAVSYVDTELSPNRAKAIEFYRAETMGAVEPGQSSVVSSDVRDVVQGQLPDLLRIFFSAENVVEYEPNGSEDEALAQRQADTADQATDYANYVFQRDNDGFTILHGAFKDALLQKVGIVKYWWDESVVVSTEHYTGLDEMGLFVLEQDAEIIEVKIEKTYADKSAPPNPGGAPGSPEPAPAKLSDVTAKRKTTKGRIRCSGIPGEEFIIDRKATSLDDFTLCGHRSMMTVSDLVALGYDEDEVNEHIGSDELASNVEYIERQPYGRTVGSFDTANPSAQLVLYCEIFTYIDTDGDGIAELVKCCTMGSGYEVMYWEPVGDIGFADFHCDPEPHTFFGLSQYDVTRDIQRIKTHIVRNTLDSLAQSIHPRTAVVEGQANIDDVLNNEVGGVIRMRAPGMVQPLDTPFVGQQAMPVIEYFDEAREMRTGVSRSQLGLEADSMQSTTKLAVQQSISGSQGKIELLARVLANGMRRLFKGILHLTVANQDRPRTVLMRGQWVTMDPRTWVADLDVKVNIALGSGTTDTKIAALTNIITKQELILQTLGPSNPIVSLAQYANALRAYTELAGFRNSSRFFNAVDPKWQPPQPSAPPPDPKIALGQQQLAIEKQRADQQHQLGLMKEQRESLKDKSDAFIKTKEVDLKYQTQLETAHMGAFSDHHAEVTRQMNENSRAMMGHVTNLIGQHMGNQSQQQIASLPTQGNA